MDLFQIRSANGLPQAELGMLNDLLLVWSKKLSRNQRRVQYYAAKNKLRDLGISIPPSLTEVETVVGWPAKAVDALAARSRFDGFTTDSGDSEALQEVLDANRFKVIYRQAVTSELISSCAFMTVSSGGAGEPPVIVSAYSALNGSAMWDMRRKRIKCGMTVVDVDNRPDHQNEPLWVNLYTDNAVWEIKKDGGKWRARKNSHSMGRPMMEPLVYRPTLDRPFGQSRISRAVMSITDSAVRTALRSEVAAEFFTAPQKYLLGADDDVFEKLSKWEAYIGNIFTVTKDEDGDVPKFGQLAQASMQPHTDYMRSLAARFSGETSIPVSELGVIHDNPASAEAIYAAKESLVIEAENLNETNGEALKAVGKMVLAALRDVPLDSLDENESSIKPVWKNPAMPSIVSQADAMVKIISAMPWIAESRVALEEFGFGEDKITRLMNDKRRAEARALLAQQEQQAAPQQEEAHASAIDDTQNFYRIMSVLKDCKRGAVTRQVAVRMLESLGVAEDEAGALIDANDEPGGAIEVPQEAVEVVEADDDPEAVG